MVVVEYKVNIYCILFFVYWYFVVLNFIFERKKICMLNIKYLNLVYVFLCYILK